MVFILHLEPLKVHAIILVMIAHICLEKQWKKCNKLKNVILITLFEKYLKCSS